MSLVAVGGAVVAEHGRWTAERLLPLARGEELRAVRVLRLRGNHLDGAGLRALLATPLFADLDELELSDNPLGAGALADVAAALPGLQRLGLAGVGLDGAAGVGAMRRLRHLVLAGNPLGDAGPVLRALGAPLETLDLGGCELRVPPPLDVLAGLVELSLARNPLGGDALGAAVAPAAATLQVLDVARVAGADGVLAALGAAGAPALAELHAETAAITDDGAVALTGGALPSLRVLDLARNRIGDRGARALAAWTGAPRLAEVRLYGCPIDRDVAHDLAGRHGHLHFRPLDA